MKFRTKYDRLQVSAEAGSPIKVKYKGAYDENGVFDLVESGKENLYDYIQSFKDSVDIHVILAKYMNGDQTALNRYEPLFGDFSQLPDNLPAMLNVIEAAKDSFNQLDPALREKFGNNFLAFAGAIGSDDFNKLFGIGEQKVEDVIVPTVDNLEKEVEAVTE